MILYPFIIEDGYWGYVEQMSLVLAKTQRAQPILPVHKKQENKYYTKY